MARPMKPFNLRESLVAQITRIDSNIAALESRKKEISVELDKLDAQSNQVLLPLGANSPEKAKK